MGSRDGRSAVCSSDLKSRPRRHGTRSWGNHSFALVRARSSRRSAVGSSSARKASCDIIVPAYLPVGREKRRVDAPPWPWVGDPWERACPNPPQTRPDGALPWVAMSTCGRRALVRGAGAALAGRAVGLDGSRSASAAADDVFRWGVASFDPGPDSVLLWTRIAPGPTDSTTTLSWVVASDADLGDEVASGTVEVGPDTGWCARADRSEEHTSELQSLMRTSYAVFCLKKTKIDTI